MSTELWWHRYAGICAHGIFTATTGGESPTHPEQLTTLTYTVESIGCGTEGCTTTLTYVRSWNHQPSEAEEEAVMPEEFRDGDVLTEWDGPMTPGVA